MWKNKFLSLFKRKRSHTRPPSHCINLPTEIWMIIFHYCTVSDLLSFGACSKNFHHLLFSTDLFWKQRMESVEKTDLCSFLETSSTYFCSNFEKCLFIDIATNSLHLLDSKNKSTKNSIPSVAFVGGEMSQRNHLAQVLCSLENYSSDSLFRGFSDLLIKTVLYHRKVFHLHYFTYEVYGARYHPYTGIFQHQTCIVVLFNIADAHNRLEKKMDQPTQQWKWIWKGEVGQAMELICIAKARTIPFIFLVGYSWNTYTNVISPSTVDVELVAELCKEYGVYFYNIEPEQLGRNLYRHNQQQMNYLKHVIQSLLIYSNRIKKL